MKKDAVLVTGGAGFIGSHVVDALLKTHSRVVVLDDLSGGFSDNVNPKARLVRGSVTNPTLIESLFKRYRFPYVFHLAAYAAEGLSHFIKRFNYTNNVIGSVNLINAAVRYGTRCFVFTSSIAVYGAAKPPMREEQTPEPEDSYGIAKYAVELELEASRRLFGLNYVIFRPHNVYGERQNIGDRYRNVIGIFMNQAMQKKPMSVFGNGRQKRAFSYIGDIAPVIARSIDRPKAYNQIFNIGADLPYTVNDLVRIVSREMGVPPKPTYLASRKEVHVAYSSHAKVKRFFGKHPTTALEDGIARMAAWARSVGPRRTKPFRAIEITKNLPPSWKA